MDGNQAQTLLKVDEVAAELRVSPFTVYRYVESGRMAALRVGENGPLRIPRQSLDEFLVPAGPKAAA